MFRYITLPMIAPFLMVAVIIRTIDALKSFDIIYAITQGGPGTASETINLYLYSVAFAYYDIGYGSAIAVVFFVLVVAAVPAHAAICASARNGPTCGSAHEPAQTPRPHRPAASSRFVLVSPAVLFFLWMISLSLKFEIDNAAYPPIFIPERFAWKNYAERVRVEPLPPLSSCNSLIVTGVATLLALLIGVPAGYGIARMKATKAAVVILIARMTPGLSYLIPLFLLFQWLGLLGTLWPQIIIHLVITVPIVDLDHDRLFRDDADGARGGGHASTAPTAGRCSATSRCRSPSPASRSRFILAVIFSWNNFVFGIVLAGRETRTLAGRGLQHAVLRAGELGAARGGGADRHPAGAAADDRSRNGRSSPG